MDWVSRRVSAAREQMQDSGVEVPEAVSSVLEELLAHDLQGALKPEQVRKIVERLALANRGAA
jgi:hypothetical protein